MSLSFAVFSIDQPGGTFYYAKIKASDLKNSLIVRRRSTDAEGVQRDLTVKRIREISGYLELADAILPTPIVISVPTAELSDLPSGLKMTIPIPDSGKWGEIIDGQHRYEGLNLAKNFGDYEIPICIFVDLGTEDKAEVFSTINSTQVKVPKSYIYDLFDYTDKNIPAKFCHDVCKTLNYDENGPLYKRVKMLGKKLNNSEVLSQAAVVDAILPLITKNEKTDERLARDDKVLAFDPSLTLRELYIQKDVVVFAKIATNFLTALKDVAGEVWDSYVLRSVGFKVFMRVLAYLAVDGIAKGELSQDFFHRRLLIASEAIASCSTIEGTNKRAEDSAVDRIMKSLASITNTEER